MNTQFEVLNTKSFENIDIRIPGLLKKPVALNFNLSEPYNSKNTCSLSSFDNEEENFDNFDNFAGDWSPYTTRDDIFTNNYDEDDSVSTASYLTMRGVAAKVLMTEIKDFDLTNPSQKEQAGSQVHVGSKNRNQSSKSGVGTGAADENNANTSSQMNDRDSSQNNPNGQNTSQNQDHYSNAVTFVPNWQKQLCQAQYALFTRQIYTFLNNKNSIKKQISAPIYSSSSGLIVSITNGNSLSVKMKDYSEIKQKRGRPPIKIHDNYAIRVFAGRLALEYFKKLNHIEKAIPSTAILGISNEQRQKTLSPISIAGLETYNRTENRSGLSKIISLSRMILIMSRIEEAISSVTPCNVTAHWPTIMSYSRCEIKLICWSAGHDLMNYRLMVHLRIDTSNEGADDKDLYWNANNCKIKAIHSAGSIEELNATVPEIQALIKRLTISFLLIQCQLIGRALGWVVSPFPPISSVSASEKLSPFDGGLILTSPLGKPTVAITGVWPNPRVFITAPSELQHTKSRDSGSGENTSGPNNIPSNVFPMRSIIESRIKNLPDTLSNRKDITGFDVLKFTTNPNNLLRDENKWKNLPSYYRELDMNACSGVSSYKSFLFKLEHVLFSLMRMQI